MGGRVTVIQQNHALSDNGYGVVRRCAGHSCSDRNRCLAHITPVEDGQSVIWMPWYDDRQGNKCPHFINDDAR